MRDMVLALGCSFTDPLFISGADIHHHLRAGWKMWPKIFTDKLSKRDGIEYELVNRGKSGAGQDWCATEFFEEWMNNKKRLKVVLWGGTSWYRMMHITNKARFGATDFSDPKWYNEDELKSRLERMKTDGMYEYVKSVALSLRNRGSLLRIARKNINLLLSIKDMCETKDIDFMY